ncbi:MAG: hypothetical protein WAU96_16385 [Anaerolineae bacterium]|nr:hypothetical protein [Thermoflexales bacterium]HQW35757.1 hypothetical protein [Thermoflexales bacterium]
MKQVTKTRWLTISFLRNMSIGVAFCAGYYFIVGFFWGALSDNIFEATDFLERVVGGVIIGLIFGCILGIVFASTASILTSLVTYAFRKKLSPQKGMILGFVLGTLSCIAIIIIYFLSIPFYFQDLVLDASHLGGFMLVFGIPALLVSLGVAIANKKMLQDYEIKESLN